jgi:uncharacterized protein YecE (DUF72 family)
MRYLVGTAGWSYSDWKGTVYPQPPPPDFDELSFLADHVDCVEINSSFYRPPAAKSAESWVRRVAHHPDFTFTAKLWRGFTHERDGRPSEDDARAFLDGIAPLEEAGKLGALLLQFPWYFLNDGPSRDRVRRLAERFGEGRRLVIEIRHRSWTTAEGLAFLTGLGLNLCSVDMPLARATVRPAAFVTGPVAYLRLHGRNAKAWFSKDAERDAKYDYLYQPGELDAWLQKLAQARGKPETAYVIANNHFRGQAPCNALQIKSRLAGRRVAVPAPLLATYPELEEVAEP